MSENWLEKRNAPTLSVSASKIETKRMCTRKWWLGSVRRLKEPQKSFLTLGNAVHDICERFLLADDYGRGADGLPVNLYPEGWDTPKSRFSGGLLGRITPHEASLVRNLMNAAIEGGVLERRKDRQVEWQFEEPILQVGEYTAIMRGFIDVLYPDTIEDHKTAKNRKYFKSKNKLRENTQMLIYAKIALRHMARTGAPLPPYLNLRHNQFSKDPNDPVVRKTEVTATVSEIDAHWAEVLRDVTDMLYVRQSTDHWYQIPDPPTGDRACNAYGGCPYRTICGGVESVEGYENRLAKHTAPQYTINPSSVPLTIGLIPATSLERIGNMTQAAAPAQNFNDLIAQAKGQGVPPQPVAPAAPVAAAPPPPPAAPQQPAAAPTQAPAVVPPVAVAPPVAPVAPAPVPGGVQVNPAPMAPVAPAPAAAPTFLQEPGCELPPWVDPNALTPINNGCGFNDQGLPDRIAQAQASQKGLPIPTMFTMLNNQNGTISWTGNDGTPAAGRAGMTRYAVGNPVAVQQQIAPPPAPVQTTAAPAPVAVAPAVPVAPAPQQPVNVPQAPAPAPVQASPPPPAPAAVVPPAPGGVVAPANVVVQTPAAPAGRPKKGFTLLVNCIPQATTNGRKGSGRHVYDLHAELEAIKTTGFLSNESIAAQITPLTEKFGNDMCYATGVGDDPFMGYLVNALKPQAGMVIMGTN